MPAKKMPEEKYTVYVDDNYHSMDEDERYKLGDFDTEAEALKAMKNIVDGFLTGAHTPGKTAAELLKGYKSFGEDPWCAAIKFSAWQYAEKRCAEICG